MKKIAAFSLAVLLIISMLTTTVLSAWAPTYSKLPPIERDSDVLARIVIGSDIHIGDTHATPKLENAYRVIGELGGADAFFMAGDLTNGGTPEQFDELMRIVKNGSKTLTIEADGFTGNGTAGAPVDTTILVMGNHDFYDKGKSSPDLFTEKTGQVPDKLYWIAGKVPVIKVSMTSSIYRDTFAPKHDFIKESLEAIDKAGYKGHIFIVTHIATVDTVIGSVDVTFDPKTVELMSKYPQLIHVSGHSHEVINSPLFIDQSAGFTCMTDGVVGEDYDDGDPEALGSGLIIFDVKSNGKTEFHRVDLENGELLYDHENWTLDASDTADDFIYFTDPAKTTNKNAYHLKSGKPSFSKDAWVKFKDVGDRDSVTVEFTPNAIPATSNNHDYVWRYVVKAIPEDGNGTTVTSYVKSDTHKPESKRAKTFTVALNGLDWNVDYKIAVFGETSYGVLGDGIYADGTVNVGDAPFKQSDPRLLYDIDYSYGKQNDAMGHTLFEGRGNKIVYDETIGQNALSLYAYQTHRYSFDATDFESLKNEFTLEAYFNIPDVEPDQTLIGMNDCCGLSVGVFNGYLKVTAETPKSTNAEVIYSIPVNAGEWTHIVVTYDYKDFSLYLNGELYYTAIYSGGLSHVRDESLENSSVINIGGAENGKLTYGAAVKGTLVNCLRLYRGDMSADEAKLAYEKATKPSVKLPFADVAEDAWYADTVRYAYENSLMNGTSDTAFAPATATSRAMIVQLLYNMEGRPEVTYKPIFTDVKEDAWYADAVIWAYENGVTTGSSATTFSPDALVTREQVAVFLYRFMKDYKGEDMAEGADITSFPDHDKISPYAGFADAVVWANSVGIITGKTSSDGAILAPLDNAQRCESATMFARFHRSFVA